MKLTPVKNRWGEVIPSHGDIWKDRDEHRNLILDTFEEEGEMCAVLIDLDTGIRWEREPFESWIQSQVDGLPYYRYLVG